MGLVSGALQHGKNALLSYQSALQVIGNNVSNAGVDGYTRQSPVLASRAGVPLPEGLMPGGGVALTALQRHIDEALETRLRNAIGQEQRSLAESEALVRVEALYNELTDEDLSSMLGAFFNTFADVQGNPLDVPTRGIVISTGQALASQMRRMRTELLDMHDQVNKDLVGVIRHANQLAGEVAGLNIEVVRAEASGQGAASSLRDQRDRVLRQLAELMDIQTAETPEGAVNIYIGNEPLVQYGQSRGLTASQEQVGDRTVVAVRFTDNNGTVRINGGQIAGLVSARDNHMHGQIKALDSLAANLIRQVNLLHSQGQGLDGLTDVTGAFAVSDPAAALNSEAAGLSFPPANGTFKIAVTDQTTGETVEYVVPVSLTGLGADSSLDDVVSYINANVGNLTASVTSENRLRLQADGNWSFTFSEDSSGVLAGLGMNAFFTGDSAANIGVDADLAAAPQRLAAALTRAPGDGGNAGRLAGLATAPLADLNNMSILDQWHSVVGQLAVASAAARHSGEASHNVSQSLQAQREAISGVNMDEEAVNLMRYQRSFQAAARYITLVDQLVDEMLAMVR